MSPVLPKGPPPKPEDVLHEGRLLLQIPLLHTGWESDNRLQLWEMPDGTRYMIRYEQQVPEFMKTADVTELIEAYKEVVKHTETLLELFYGEDKNDKKRH